jgi:hypothetical protein
MKGNFVSSSLGAVAIGIIGTPRAECSQTKRTVFAVPTHNDRLSPVHHRSAQRYERFHPSAGSPFSAVAH